jgi:hypothetical protein
MKSSRLLSAGAVLLAIQLLAACADTAELDQCSQYDELVGSVEELQALDLMTVKADQIRAQADAVEAELDELEAVSEGRLDTAISTFRATVVAILQVVLEDVDTGALEAARSQREQLEEDLAEDWSVLRERMDPVCETA